MSGAGPRDAELATALTQVRERLSQATVSAGREPGDVELLVVTKFFPAADVATLVGLGCRAFGESRDQEARAKIADLAASGIGADTGVRWHMVGQIQRNKARSIAGWADVAHSVDSVKLAAALDRAALAAREDGLRAAPLAVYVQVSLDGDVSRGGVDVDDTAAVDELCAAVDRADGLNFLGLMGIPPVGADPEVAFGRLGAELRRVQSQYPQALGLSAGMTGDLDIAVKHGSTCVRVGTAVMGPRPLTSP